MTNEPNATSGRKADHIRICLEEDVKGRGISNGFENYRFRHCALPETDFSELSLSTVFLKRRMDAPLLISSMTGGASQAGGINRRLAEAAQSRGWAMGLGSMRVALEREELVETFAVREQAPSVFILANLGAVQLNYGMGPDDCRRAVELAQADALVLHLNALQELFQPEGDTHFKGLLDRIEEVCRKLPVPVGVKEVGWGIDGETARRLSDAGAAFVDVAGAGGTSWSQVEKYRNSDPLRYAAADAFADWGIPTAECIREVRMELPDMPLIASGGLSNGVEAAKAIALGADMAGFGRSLLRDAVTGDEVAARLERIELELKAAMFAIGARDVRALRSTGRLVRQE